jgi:hypothetical protein
MGINKFFIVFGLAANTIFGTVKDYSSEEKLVGVKIISSVDTTYTNLDGEFEIELKNLEDSIKVEYISYEKVIITPYGKDSILWESK